jgi:2-keto-3-deoxy-L-rhamnonate aldolase RhmA
MRINTVKKALKEGKAQFGCNTSMLRSPEVPRILAAAGLHWSYLDSEHGGFDLETLQDLIRAANEAGLCPIVRVADLQYPLVARALRAAPGRNVQVRPTLLARAPRRLLVRGRRIEGASRGRKEFCPGAKGAPGFPRRGPRGIDRGADTRRMPDLA